MRQWHDISANRRTMAYLLFSAIVLAVMWAVAVGPARRQIAEARLDQSRLNARLEEQKALYPIYRQLQKEKEDKTVPEPALQASHPQKKPAGIDQGLRQLSAMAQAAGLEVLEIFPSMDSIAKDTGHVLMEARLIGDFPDLRQFLIDMTGWDGYEGMEGLSIKSSSPNPEYKLNIRINMS